MSILGYPNSFRVSTQGIRHGTRLYRAKRYQKTLPKGLSDEQLKKELENYADELFTELHGASTYLGVFRDLQCEHLLDHSLISAEIICLPELPRFRDMYNEYMMSLVFHCVEELARAVIQSKDQNKKLQDCYALHHDLESWLHSCYGEE